MSEAASQILPHIPHCPRGNMQLEENADRVEHPQVQEGSVPWPNVVMLIPLGLWEGWGGGWKKLQMPLFDQLAANTEKMGEMNE